MAANYYRQQKYISKVYCDILMKSTMCSYRKWWNCVLKSNYQNNESCLGCTCLIGWQDARSEQSPFEGIRPTTCYKVRIILSNIPQSACMSICHIKSPPWKRSSPCGHFLVCLVVFFLSFLEFCDLFEVVIIYKTMQPKFGYENTKLNNYKYPSIFLATYWNLMQNPEI
jgi:hypothetical protein